MINSEKLGLLGVFEVFKGVCEVYQGVYEGSARSTRGVCAVQQGGL